MATKELHVVFGATGGAGAAVVRALLAQGKNVRAVSRRGTSVAPAGVEVFKADAADLASAREATQGATVVYNCTNAPYTAWPEQFPALWRNVTAAAAAAEARLVMMDNLYMYGPSDGPLTETTPLRATGRKGVTRIQMADEALKAHTSGAVQVAIGRAADYFGPGVSLATYSEASFRKALRGARVMGGGNLDLPHTQAFIDDVARGLVTLGQHEQAFGQIWHLPHAPAISQRAFINLMFEQAGQAPKIGRLPGFVMRVAGLVVPIMRELAEMLYQYEAPFVVDSSKFERAFSIAATPTAAAIGQTLEWLRAHPQLKAAPSH